MFEWWQSLTSLNQVFYAGAGIFTLIFLWQFISAMIGLGGGHFDLEAGPHADVDGDIDGPGGVDTDGIEGHSIEEAGESVMAFRILSVRAILAFFTLFCWAGALYLNAHKPVGQALVLALAWGAAAWVFVAVLMHWMRKLAETGTARLSTAVGHRGTVYMDIPAGGQGQVRVTVSGVVSVVRAHAAGGATIPSGTPVRVTRLLDANTVEVQPAGSDAGDVGAGATA